MKWTIVLTLLVLLSCAKQSPWAQTPLPTGSIPLTDKTDVSSIDLPQTILVNFMSLVGGKGLYEFRLHGLTSIEGGWKAIITRLRIGQKDFVYEVNTTVDGGIISFSLIDIREMGF